MKFFPFNSNDACWIVICFDTAFKRWQQYTQTVSYPYEVRSTACPWPSRRYQPVWGSATRGTKFLSAGWESRSAYDNISNLWFNFAPPKNTSQDLSQVFTWASIVLGSCSSSISNSIVFKQYLEQYLDYRALCARALDSGVLPRIMHCWIQYQAMTPSVELGGIASTTHGPDSFYSLQYQILTWILLFINKKLINIRWIIADLMKIYWRNLLDYCNAMIDLFDLSYVEAWNKSTVDVTTTSTGSSPTGRCCSLSKYWLHRIRFTGKNFLYFNLLIIIFLYYIFVYLYYKFLNIVWKKHEKFIYVSLYSRSYMYT